MTVNLFVKNCDISSPRDALSAISSALGDFLDVLGIELLLLLRCFPRVTWNRTQRDKTEELLRRLPRAAFR
jgi:hypothetical protein